MFLNLKADLLEVCVVEEVTEEKEVREVHSKI